MNLKIVSEKNKKYYKELVPSELGFLLHDDSYLVLGLVEEADGEAIAIGTCVLSFNIPDAVMIEWFYVDEAYVGDEFGATFLDAACDIARENARTRIMVKLWGKGTRDAEDYLFELGFVPASTERTDSIYYIADLISTSAFAGDGVGARKAGFELKEVTTGVYVPMLFGNPQPDALKKSISAALYEVAKKEGDSAAVLYLRCAPQDPLSVIRDYFMQGNRIGSACYEASVDTPEYLAGVLEEQRLAGESMRREMDSIPTEFTMTGLAEY